jgi:cell wall-associated NlpC family hydrolase
MKSAILTCFAAWFFLLGCQPSARFRSEELQKSSIQNPEQLTDLDRFIENWLNVPYRYGGMSRNGIDCSGFSSLTLRDVYGITIPRSATEQYRAGQKVRINDLIPGDLVFFKNIRGGDIDHVGVFIGQDRFAHASESAGVIISELREDYFQDRFVGACRFHR